MLVNPRFEAPTAEMRAALRKEVPMNEVGGRAGGWLDGASLDAHLCWGLYGCLMLGHSIPKRSFAKSNAAAKHATLALPATTP